MTGVKSEHVLVERWREVLSLHARTACELDRELNPHGLGASDFEVLDLLAEGNPDDGGCTYRVQGLADRVHLSRVRSPGWSAGWRRTASSAGGSAARTGAGCGSR